MLAPCRGCIGIQALYLGEGGVDPAWVVGGHGTLIVNLQPVLVALAPLVGEQVSRRQWAGVVLGLAGAAAVSLKLGFGAGQALPCCFALALLASPAARCTRSASVPQFDLRTGQVVQFAASLAVTPPVAC